MQIQVMKMGFNKPSKDKKANPENKETFKFNLSDFTIMHTLGKGSSAIVKLAKHKKQNCKVVFKIYDKYKLMESQLKKSLFKEIEILKTISHPNIIKLYDVLEDEKHIYLVMEYISGGSLQQHLRIKSKKLTEDDAKRIFKQISSAVRYLHSKSPVNSEGAKNLGIFHRDIKLDNILLDYRKNVKLIDFGFSIN